MYQRSKVCQVDGVDVAEVVLVCQMLEFNSCREITRMSHAVIRMYCKQQAKMDSRYLSYACQVIWVIRTVVLIWICVTLNI